MSEFDFPKDQWIDGPWMSEPDHMEWRDEATGYPCMIHRNHSGALCGYVAVPPDHPAYGRSYDGEPKPLHDKRIQSYTDSMKEVQAKVDRGETTYDESIRKVFSDVLFEGEWKRDELADKISGLEVHGGLTYSDSCQGALCHVPEPGELDNVWWFGFDCQHCFDFAPGYFSKYRHHGYPFAEVPGEREVYRDIAYVQAECASLAKQLKDIA